MELHRLFLWKKLNQHLLGRTKRGNDGFGSTGVAAIKKVKKDDDENKIEKDDDENKIE